MVKKKKPQEYWFGSSVNNFVTQTEGTE